MVATVLTAAVVLSLGGVAVVQGYHVKGYSVRSTTVALDVMQQLMTGDEEFFDPAYVEKLGQCWDDTHPDLRQVQDIAWSGLADFFENDGFQEDKWGGTVTVPAYHEYNVSTQSDGVVIYEPCNYASNVAYYHDATEMCNNAGQLSMSRDSEVALIQTFSFLGWGSALWHGSHTVLGAVVDNRFIAILAYIAYQASIENLRDLGASSIITDLTNTPREQNGVEMAATISDMFLNKSPPEWENVTMGIDLPNYYTTFAGIVCSTMTLAFDDAIVDSIIPPLMDLFNLPQEIRDFINNQYLPEIRALTADIRIGLLEKVQLIGNFASTMVKLLYAFVWQEQTLDIPFVFDPEANVRGNELIPVVNAFANRLNDFTFYEENFQNGTAIYPGDAWCNNQEAHSKWHVQSAIGLLDLVYLCDNINGLTSKQRQESSFDLEPLIWALWP